MEYVISNREGAVLLTAPFFIFSKSDTLINAFRRPKDAFRQKSVYKTPNACIIYKASVKIRPKRK